LCRVTPRRYHSTVAAIADQRRTIKKGIALGCLGGLALYALGYFAWPSVGGVETTEARVELALWIIAAPAVFVYAVFFSCLRLRDAPEAVDPLRGAESPRWKINQRVLSNSVELATLVWLVRFSIT
jgi:hypothetical protein